MFRIVNSLAGSLLKTLSLESQPQRTVIILKRRFPCSLHKKGRKPKPLKARHMVYDVVEDTEKRKKPNIEVLLIKYVEGFGQPGELVSAKPDDAYDKLLLPQNAVYATPENLEKYSNMQIKLTHSSKLAQRTVNSLAYRVIPILMNKDEPWVLEPWHLRVHLRKAGIIVPEEAITMPPKPISGPSMELESKDFPITITINNMETVAVRCRIHLWSTKLDGRLPYEENHWLRSCEPLFPEDKEILDAMPRIRPKPPKISQRRRK